MAWRLATKAIADLREIDDFINRRKENPIGAEIVSKYFFEAFDRIGRDPIRCGCRLRPDITTKRVKFVTVRRYIVIYDDSRDPVIILRIAGVRQNFVRLLNKRAATRQRGL